MTGAAIINVMLGRGLGGIEQAVMDYGDALRFAGYDVHTIIDSQAAIRPELELQGTRFTTLDNWGAWDPWAARRLRGMLQAVNPRACIAHGNRAVTLLRRAGGRHYSIIGVMHNYKIHGRGLTHLFCPTKDLCAQAAAQGVAEDRATLLPNLVRVPALPPLRIPHAPIVIGAMGRMVAKKGFDILLEALALLHRQEKVFEAVIAGDGPERAALERQAQALGLQGLVTFPGWATDKPAFFNGIDIFCLPSCHEPFGIVLLEAMAQSLPVIAAASEGPSEIITHGRDGLLAAKGDANAMAEGIGGLLSRPEDVTRLGAEAYATVRRHYDLPVVAQKLDLALQRLAPL